MKKPTNQFEADRNRALHDGPTIVNDEGRTCNKGGTFKPWDDFYKRSDSYTGHEGTCIACKKKAMRENWAKKRSSSKPYQPPQIDSDQANSFLMRKAQH